MNQCWKHLLAGFGECGDEVDESIGFQGAWIYERQRATGKKDKPANGWLRKVGQDSPTMFC